MVFSTQSANVMTISGSTIRPAYTQSETTPGYSAVGQRDKTDMEDHEQTKATKHSRKHRMLHFGWWWEFGTIFASTLSTAAIFSILAYVHGRPLASWEHSIQPASLVAIIATITKSSLLASTAVCLSQLKWSYFEEPRSLAHIQAFDDASRGPYGALFFLWKTRGGARLAGIGALVTVFSIMFEPFTQQAIHFPEKVLPLTNETGTISYSKGLSDLPWSWGARPAPTGTSRSIE
jgi:hypothetical protein